MTLQEQHKKLSEAFNLIQEVFYIRDGADDLLEALTESRNAMQLVDEELRQEEKVERKLFIQHLYPETTDCWIDWAYTNETDKENDLEMCAKNYPKSKIRLMEITYTEVVTQ